MTQTEWKHGDGYQTTGGAENADNEMMSHLMNPGPTVHNTV